MKPRKPAPFTLMGEVVASCLVDDGEVVDKGRRLIQVDAVFHLIDENECRQFKAWLDRAIAWRDAR